MICSHYSFLQMPPALRDITFITLIFFISHFRVASGLWLAEQVFWRAKLPKTIDRTALQNQCLLIIITCNFWGSNHPYRNHHFRAFIVDDSTIVANKIGTFKWDICLWLTVWTAQDDSSEPVKTNWFRLKFKFWRHHA